MCRFAWAWMALRARNASPSGRATYNPQSTCHGPRPGPKLAYGVRTGSLCANGAESTRIDPRPGEKKVPNGEKTHLYIYVYKVPLRDVCVT